MTDTHAANPQGAGSDLHEAATKIGALLRPTEPKGQPQEKAPPVQANQTQEPKVEQKVEGERKPVVKDPATGRFTKAEPETAEDSPEVEEKSEATEKADTSETEGDQQELADSVEGLAEQLGIDPDQLLDHLRLTAKINGEEKPVNLRELRDGYQMQADYRQKTAKIAEERKTFEVERQQYTQQRDHLTSQLQPLVQELESLVAVDEQRMMELLNNGDLLGFEQANIQAKQRAQKLEIAKREAQRLSEQQQYETRQRLEKDVLENERLLVEMRPEWGKNPEKGAKELSEIRRYLKEDGFAGELVDGLYDARTLILADKARKWDALQKAKPDKLNVAKQAPKFLKPGPSKPAEDPKVKVHSANINRLRKTGDWKDAAKALVSGGFVSRS